MFLGQFVRSSTRLRSSLDHKPILLLARNAGSFRPRRKPNKNYRPLQKPSKKLRDLARGNSHRFVELGPNGSIDRETLENSFGPMADDAIEKIRYDRYRQMKYGLTYDQEAEEGLRMVDYYMSEEGSLEDRVGQRRALAIDEPHQEGRDKFMSDLNSFVNEETLKEMELDPESIRQDNIIGVPRQPGEIDLDHDEDDEEEDQDPDVYLDPNQLAHGEWSEMLISVDRTIKLWRGGRLESYRALVIGGNLNGCGGFGVGKSPDPMDAVTKASRKTKRNIFFVDRYQNGLTRDLVGKQNSCHVNIRARQSGLRGNELVCEILKRFGIVNASIKALGKRSPYNVVLGTFKALMTHESLEEIALKRGKRLMSLDKAKRLNL